jgi:hypothetical protein
MGVMAGGSGTPAATGEAAPSFVPARMDRSEDERLIAMMGAWLVVGCENV